MAISGTDLLEVPIYIYIYIYKYKAYVLTQYQGISTEYVVKNIRLYLYFRVLKWPLIVMAQNSLFILINNLSYRNYSTPFVTVSWTIQQEVVFVFQYRNGEMVVTNKLANCDIMSIS